MYNQYSFSLILKLSVVYFLTKMKCFNFQSVIRKTHFAFLRKIKIYGMKFDNE